MLCVVEDTHTPRHCLGGNMGALLRHVPRPAHTTPSAECALRLQERMSQYKTCHKDLSHPMNANVDTGAATRDWRRNRPSSLQTIIRVKIWPRKMNASHQKTHIQTNQNIHKEGYTTREETQTPKLLHIHIQTKHIYSYIHTHTHTPVDLSVVVDADAHLNFAAHTPKATDFAGGFIILAGIDLSIRGGHLHIRNQQIVLLCPTGVGPQDDSLSHILVGFRSAPTNNKTAKNALKKKHRHTTPGSSLSLLWKHRRTTQRRPTIDTCREQEREGGKKTKKQSEQKRDIRDKTTGGQTSCVLEATARSGMAIPGHAP